MDVFTPEAALYARLALRQFLQLYGAFVSPHETTAEEIVDHTGRHYLVKCHIGLIRAEADFYPQGRTSGDLSVYLFIRRGVHEVTVVQKHQFDGYASYGRPFLVLAR